jgi:hypothetical protein
MAEVTRRTRATPQEVYAVLADGWSYAGWVVGTSGIREVEEGWPDPGCRIHHSFGVWPLLVDDSTSVLESERDRRVLLQARGWPAGAATVEVRLTPDAGGTVVTLVEDATHGPGSLVPEPLRRVVLVPRNVEALRRLCLIAEGRGAGTT